jgi:tetrahydromethanopterin S-methyltransferase subunit D
MRTIFAGRPCLVGAALMTLTLVSATVSEERGLTQLAAVGLFIIAAIKAELVLDNFMEAPQAEAHWKWLYRGWIAVVTLLLSIGFVG